MLFKEDLIKYLTQGHIHVSKQDYFFFNNLVKITGEGNVTTGQNKLLDKLIDKYRKQLRSNNLDIQSLKNLSWKNPLLETLEEYRKTYISVTKQEITVRNPFSKKFISALQKHRSNLIWNKKRKCYTADYNTFNLKHTLDLVYKNFEDVVCSKNIQDLLIDIKKYENCYWDPTLVKVGNNFYIAALNEPLNKILPTKLNDDSQTIFFLSKYGIKIDDDLVVNEEQKFATSHIYDIDIDEIDILINYLHNLNIKKILIEGHVLYKNTLFKEIVNKFKQSGIEVSMLSDSDSNDFQIILTFRNSYAVWNPGRACKVILIKNSRPVYAK